MNGSGPHQELPPLAQPVTTLSGVGPERARLLEKLEIRTVEDLLLHRPRRYENRQAFRSIAELQLGEPATTRGTVVAFGVKWFQRHTRSVFELILDDGSARLHCRWWNMPYMERNFAIGDELVVYGKLQGQKPRCVDHPETEKAEPGEEAFVHFNRITPIYPLTEGVGQRWLRGLVWRTLERFEEGVTEPFPQLKLTEPNATPEAPVALPSRREAVRMLHFPERMEDIEVARARLALDEFIQLQRHMRLRRRNFESHSQGLPCGGDNRLMKPFLAALGFHLTAAQTRVLRELRKDMAGAFPMRRLLQGDVGSGKTAVAACCALMAIESGFDVVLMAPTEILAEQHFQNFSRWFAPLGVPVELRTGSRKEKSEAPARACGEALQGRPGLFVGTHALIEEGFEVGNLGLVIIDEQHKFGVAQREQLVRKGRYPHLLVMTATPIPRTLGLTLYGELEVSVIDELPPGRGRIRTFVRSPETLPKVWEFIRSKLGQGRQAYVVYPRVEEDGGKTVKAVAREYETLAGKLAPFRVGLLHGRLRGPQKEEVMAAFRANQVQVLLATALIEVGVDVPNATVMLVENAELFGLAQLHQLRGRVGRGAHDSYCILVGKVESPEVQARLHVLEESVDGFRIAEADLKLRGPGELLGQQQSGMPNFRFGDLVNDLDLIRRARDLAVKLVD